jgi:hypothetical protein
VVRFERSTLPEHKGTRTCVLRFIKIITSVKCVIPLYDGKIVPPKEGELHRRTHGNVNLDHPTAVKAWSVDIDKNNSMGRGLHLLWDT